MKARKLLALAALIAAALAGVWAVTGAGPAPLITAMTARPLHGAPGDWAVEAVIDNRGDWDILRAAHSAQAHSVTIQGAGAAGVVLPAGSAPSLSLDGVFLRLNGLEGAARDGRLVPITLTFARAGEVAAQVRLSTQTGGEGMGHAMPGHGAVMDLPASAAPKLGLRLHPDGDAWTVALELANLTLSAEAADTPHQPGVGHGHLYLNGLKLRRLYDTTARISALPPGEHLVRVSLNTNDHRPFAADGTPVEAVALIVQPD